MHGRWGAVLAACALAAAGCGGKAPKETAPLPNEPAGFGGLQWGADSARLPAGMAEDRMSDFMHQTAGIRIYRKEKEDAEIGGALPGKVQYCFYKGRFYMVIVEFRGAGNYEKIRARLSGLHGAGGEDRREGAVNWTGRDVDILLLKKGMLVYVFKPIDLVKMRDEREKRARLLKR